MHHERYTTRHYIECRTNHRCLIAQVHPGLKNVTRTLARGRIQNPAKLNCAAKADQTVHNSQREREEALHLQSGG